MPWRQVQLPDAAASGEHRRIRAMFEQLYVAAGEPADMAMFCAHWYPGHTPLVLYFSPGSAIYARSLLQVLRAELCDQPTADLTLEIGRDDALERALKANA